MSRLACVVALALLAACASQNEGQGPDGGPIVGEVGAARDRAKLHTELAGLYYSRGNMNVALEELRIAVAADSSFAQAYGLYGLVYWELKQNVQAEQNFDRALRLAPNDPEINHNYGWFLCNTAREKESITYFMNAARNPLYPTPWRSYSVAGLCSLRLKNVKDAEDYFQLALRADPDEPLSLLQLAQIRYRQGRVLEARTMVERHNKLVTPSAESLWLALRIERRGGQKVAEQSYATQLRRRYPASDEFRKLQRGEYD
ncbi:MAG TPA: type IV pilus biogenesis/stability protein PilW [Burkholderiales bacterium]|jgi:type IV pilus assembly protein PilF